MSSSVPSSRASSITMTCDQAWALAEFIPRIHWERARSFAVNDLQANHICEALDSLATALHELGHEPKNPHMVSSNDSWTLADFIKRIGLTEIRRWAVNDTEARNIFDSFQIVGAALKEAGCVPR